MADLGSSFVNTTVERTFTLCIRFQLGNSFVNTTVERTFTLCIRFQLGSSFVNTKVPRKFTLCIRFQLGKSFVNPKVPRKFTLRIRFQFGNSFVNTKVPKKFTLCIRFQLGNSFVNTKVPKKFTLCICFQLGNSFANTKVEKITLCIRFQVGTGSPPLLRGRRGTMCTAKGSDVRPGVPLAWVSVSFAWQAWDNVHCQGVGCTPWGSAGVPGSPPLLRGRRGATWRLGGGYKYIGDILGTYGIYYLDTALTVCHLVDLLGQHLAHLHKWLTAYSTYLSLRALLCFRNTRFGFLRFHENLQRNFVFPPKPHSEFCASTKYETGFLCFRNFL